VRTLAAEEEKTTTELAEFLKLLGLDGKREIEFENLELDVKELVLKPSTSTSTSSKSV
jgi:hypothetical protein